MQDFRKATKLALDGTGTESYLHIVDYFKPYL